MRVILLMLLTFGVVFAAKDSIVESMSIPLGVRTFGLRKPHEVFEMGKAIRIFKATMRISPFVAETLAGDDRRLVISLRVVVPLSNQTFTNAPVLFNIDGKVGDPIELSWKAYSTLGRPNIQDVNLPADQSLVLLRSLASAREAYVSLVLYDASQGYKSFKFSPEQLADCRLIVNKFDQLESSK